MDKSGATKSLQDRAISILNRKKSIGLTSGEFGELEGVHHGTASGTMTNLHQGGKVVRLTTTRDGRKIYVLPQWTKGRATERVGNTKALDLISDLVDHVKSNPSAGSSVLIDRARKLGYVN